MTALAISDATPTKPKRRKHIQRPKPSTYTEERARLVCDAIASGGNLRKITGKKGIPAKSTVYRWLRNEQEFRDLYAFAVRIRTEALAEDIIEIADDSMNPELRIETRKWLLSKQLPRIYGVTPDDAPTPPNGDERTISYDPQKLIEADPLYQQVVAWEQAAEKVKG